MHTDSETTDISPLGFMPYMTAASLEMSDEPYFYNYSHSISKPCSKYFKDIKAGSQICIDELFENPNFKWNVELLKTAIELEPYIVLNICIKKERFNRLLRDIPSYIKYVNSIISSFVEDCKLRLQQENLSWSESNYLKKEIENFDNFWLKFNNGGKIPDNAYKEYFTLENILKYKNDWEEITEEKFSSMRRTPDTNYHYHKAYNKWDRFEGNEHVLLSYDISKLLQSMTIKLGGNYVLEDGCYLGEDNRLQEHNALSVFANHNFENEDEINKILDDDGLIDVFMRSSENGNTYLIEYIIDNLIDNRYSLFSFLELLNEIGIEKS